MIEQSLVFIKPDHFHIAHSILSELDECLGLNGGDSRRVTAIVDNVHLEDIQEHHSCHRGKSFFCYMNESYVGRQIVLAVYEGENIVQRLLDATGPTDPSKAPRDTIRGKYSGDSMERAIQEGRPVRNVIHRSESLEEALREIKVWRKFFNS